MMYQPIMHKKSPKWHNNWEGTSLTSQMKGYITMTNNIEGLLHFLEVIEAPEVSQHDLYRTVFPEDVLQPAGVQEQGKYNAMIQLQTGTFLYLHDDLKALPSSRLFGASMNCLSYAGQSGTDDMAQMLHAFIFRVYLPEERYPGYIWDCLFSRMHTRHKQGHSAPPRIDPTFIVTNGSEIWFYYLLAKPLPLYHHLLKKIQTLYNFISREIHRCFDSEVDGYACRKPRPGSIYARYPVVGTVYKGSQCRAYRTGHSYTFAELDRLVPKSAQLGFQQERKLSKSSPQVYDWFVDLAKENINMVLLSVLDAHASYAEKCNIPTQRFLDDQNMLADLLKRRYPADEVERAQGNAIWLADNCPTMLHTWSLQYIEKIIGMSLPRNKRNGRSRKQHLRMVHKKNSKEKAVRDWRKAHPNGTKTECRKDLKISKPTVNRWWDGKPKASKSTSKRLCPDCGVALEKKTLEPWFWADKGNYYTRTNWVCPGCGQVIVGRAHIVI